MKADAVKARPATKLRPAQDVHRILVLTSEPISGDALVEEIARHARHPQDDVVVVSPAVVDSALKLGAGEVDPAVDRANRRLFASVETLRRAGLHARGEVGDADPNVALTDALRSSPADEVIVATHPGDHATWLEDELVEHTARELHKPITQVVVEGQGPSRRVKEVRELLPQAEDREQQTDYLPPTASPSWSGSAARSRSECWRCSPPDTRKAPLPRSSPCAF